MVGAAGLEPACPCGQWILSPSRIAKFRHAPTTSARTMAGIRFDWRRRADSNRRITDLQSAALPLGYGAVPLSSPRIVAYLRGTFQIRGLRHDVAAHSIRR